MKKRKISYYQFYHKDGTNEKVKASNLRNAQRRRKSKKAVYNVGFGTS